MITIGQYFISVVIFNSVLEFSHTKIITVELENNGELIKIGCSCFYKNGTETPDKGPHLNLLEYAIMKLIQKETKLTSKKPQNSTNQDVLITITDAATDALINVTDYAKWKTETMIKEIEKKLNSSISSANRVATKLEQSLDKMNNQKNTSLPTLKISQKFFGPMEDKILAESHFISNHIVEIEFSVMKCRCNRK